MANDWYARYFKDRPVAPVFTKQELKQRDTNFMRQLATSPWGQTLKEYFTVPEVEEAELAFKEALQQITDPETRNIIDMAAGKISYAYEILGFCAGRFSTTSKAQEL